MTEASERDLRNHGGDVLDSVVRGERVAVARDGRPVAELRPVAAAGTPASVVLDRWATIPMIDLEVLHADLDTVLGTSM